MNDAPDKVTGRPDTFAQQRFQRRKGQLEAAAAALAARLKQLEQREKAGERKADTKRKILVGAVVLDYARKDPRLDVWLRRRLDELLKRPQDRALFGLATPPSPTDSHAAGAMPETPGAKSSS